MEKVIFGFSWLEIIYFDRNDQLLFSSLSILGSRGEAFCPQLKRFIMCVSSSSLMCVSCWFPSFDNRSFETTITYFNGFPPQPRNSHVMINWLVTASYSCLEQPRQFKGEKKGLWQMVLGQLKKNESGPVLLIQVQKLTQNEPNIKHKRENYNI